MKITSQAAMFALIEPVNTPVHEDDLEGLGRLVRTAEKLKAEHRDWGFTLERHARGDTSLWSLYAGAHFITDEAAEIGPIEIFDDDESEIVDRNRLGAALRIAITTRAQMFDAPEDVPGDEIDQLTDLIMKVLAG